MLHSRRRTGFTLIELLVVISIIAVLMGLLLPAIQKIRESAKRAQANNDISQLSNAVAQFQSTYGCPPPPTSITLKNTSYLTDGTDQNWNYLSRVWPRLPNSGVVPNLGGRDGNQSMVFFLGGYTSGGSYQGFIAQEGNPFGSGSTKKGPFFDFPATRMDGSGHFLDPYNVPYFYMGCWNGGDYNVYGACTINSFSMNPFQDANGKYLNWDKCQIISAGQNGKPGPGGSWIPGTGNYVTGKDGFDDISNFSGSKMLGVP